MWSDLLRHAITRELRTGDVLFEAGDPGDGCYHLTHGVVKVTVASSKGEERILAVLGRDAIVGDLAIIDGLPRSASVIALTDSSLRFISRTDFLTFAQSHPQIYLHLVNMLAARLRETDRTIEALAFLTAKGRVAYALGEIARALGKKLDSGAILIPDMLHQKEIAALAGVARENTNRILKEWERSKILTRLERVYRINDQAKLEREMEWQ